MIENVTLMVVLMLFGIGITWALLIGFIYFLEVLND